MSIYSTTFGVGDPDDPDDEPGVVLIRDGGTTIGRHSTGTAAALSAVRRSRPGVFPATTTAWRATKNLGAGIG